MNRGALRSALQTRLGLSASGDGLATDTALNEAIANALRDIGLEHDWPWLLTSASLTFSTTTGLAAQPTGFVKARELVIGGRPAKYAPLAEFLAVAGEGSAYVWTDLGANFQLSPTPATVPTATLYYVRQEPALSSDSDSPLIPDAYQHIVLARAAYLTNVRRARNDEAIRDDNEYQLAVRKLRDASWNRSGPRTVRRAGSTYWARW